MASRATFVKWFSLLPVSCLPGWGGPLASSPLPLLLFSRQMILSGLAGLGRMDGERPGALPGWGSATTILEEAQRGEGIWPKKHSLPSISHQACWVPGPNAWHTVMGPRRPQGTELITDEPSGKTLDYTNLDQPVPSTCSAHLIGREYYSHFKMRRLAQRG